MFLGIGKLCHEGIMYVLNFFIFIALLNYIFLIAGSGNSKKFPYILVVILHNINESVFPLMVILLFTKICK